MNWTVPGIRWTYNNYWPLFLFMSSVSLYWVLLITVLNPEDTEMHPELGGIYAKMYRQENGVFDTGGICASQSVFRRFRASCCSKMIGLFSDKPPREVRFSGKNLGSGTRRTYFILYCPHDLSLQLLPLCTHSGGYRGQSIFLPLLSSWSCPTSLARVPCCSSIESAAWVLLTLHPSLPSQPLSSMFKDLWLHWLQDNEMIHFRAVNLITPAESLLPCQVTYTQIVGIGLWASLRDQYPVNLTEWQYTKYQ